MKLLVKDMRHFKSHIQILQDPMIGNRFLTNLAEKITAEMAVDQVLEQTAEMFSDT